MSLLWPIIWIGSMVFAVLAFAITAFREHARQKAAVEAMKPKSNPISTSDGESDPALGTDDNFPSDNFEFDAGTLK